MIRLPAIIAFLIISTSPAYAVYGNYGDLMLLYAPRPITDPVGVKAEREARAMEDALLHMRIPQYALGDRIRDEALIRNEFFYHTEFCGTPHEYEDLWGMKWRRYRFTDHALSMLWIGQVVAIHDWIVIDNAWRYQLPLKKVRQLYIRYAQGRFGWGQMPVSLMIGREYGQTLEDYTNFRSFYWSFMNKHHYCVTATFWSILKSLYDRGDASCRMSIENNLSDPQTVQSYDMLTAGRLVGLLLERGLIEKY